MVGPAAGEVVVGVDVASVGGVVAVLVVGDDIVLSAVVLVVSARAGAATLSGATGRSLTWSSAALTICQVTIVAPKTTSSQIPKMPNLRMSPFSQGSEVAPSTHSQGLIKRLVGTPEHR